MHIAILDANTDRSELSARHPSELEKFRALLAPYAPNWRYDSFKVSERNLPAAPGSYDAILVSGSPASVNGAEPWIAALLAFLRAAHAQGVALFGACFGHQAIAKALGGTVGPNPQGWRLGRVETVLHSPTPWMEGAGPAMALHAAHTEQVIALPPGARALAGDDHVPNGHVALGTRVFTTQYHPELERGFMHDLIATMHATADPAMLAAAHESLEAGPVDAAQMARWIVAFVEQARG